MKSKIPHVQIEMPKDGSTLGTNVYFDGVLQRGIRNLKLEIGANKGARLTVDSFCLADFDGNVKPDVRPAISMEDLKALAAHARRPMATVTEAVEYLVILPLMVAAALTVFHFFL